MANTLYPAFKEAVLNGSANSNLTANDDTDGVFIALLTSSYTYSSSHVYYSSVVANEVTTPIRIPNCTVTNGVFDGDDVTFPSVPVATVEKVVLFRKNAGANSTWRLIAYFDSGLGNVPYVTDGSNLPIQFNSSGIFKL